MALSPKARGTVLAAALGLTVVAVVMAPPPKVEAMETVTPSAPRPHRTTPARKPQGDVPDIFVSRVTARTPSEDPFLDKLPPPPPAQEEAESAPPPPSAPPMPYSYLGKMTEDGKVVVFLGKQDNNYSVHTGDVLDGLYRVDEIADQTISMVYLPLNKKQTIAIGRENN